MNCVKSPDGIVSFADARLSPGQRTENHSLNVDEYYYIRSGTGDMHPNGILTGSVKSGESGKN
ncbi:MAG: hypothetical protein IPN97_08070 [Saprospiraceae bacterium]|nr:hypothetical protein [Saprospiraceae bacterium]